MPRSLRARVDFATRGSFHIAARFPLPLSSERRRPDPREEAPAFIDKDARARLRGALRDRYGDTIDVDGATGAQAAWLACHLKAGRRTHEVVVFARAPSGEVAHDALVDYLDALLSEMLGADANKGARGVDEGYFLPLDFEGRPYDGGFVFVRGEVRDFEAETEAARLLGEPLPQSLVRRG